MKISFKFVSFFMIFVYKSSTFDLKPARDDQKLSKSICKITNNLTGSKFETNDILISDLGGKTWTSIVNNIAKCLDDGIAIVVADFRTKMKAKRLKKASVLILAGFDHNNHVCMSS